MKTYLWTVKNKTKTKFGWKFDVHVYKVVKNIPTFLGSVENINSGSMMGEASEGFKVLIENGLVPLAYTKKYNGYAYREPLEKVGINYIEI